MLKIKKNEKVHHGGKKTETESLQLKSPKPFNEQEKQEKGRIDKKERQSNGKQCSRRGEKGKRKRKTQ